MNLDADSLKRQIPFYLTAEPEQKELLANLDALTSGARQGYVLTRHRDEFKDQMLQGDGWSGFPVYTFSTGTVKKIRGIILSNTCDISPENKRVLPTNLIFAPLVKLSGIASQFRKAKLAEARIADKIKSIRSQEVTDLFYLPAESPLDEEYVAILGDVKSAPLQAIEGVEKLFTLSMAGFYLLCFKLSIHFCRLQENVDRGAR